MKVFERASGKNEGCVAVLHEYSGNTGKLEVELPLGVAKEIMRKAVAAGGQLPVTIVLENERIDAAAVGGRIDSFDEKGARVGGTGVIGFGSLKLKT